MNTICDNIKGSLCHAEEIYPNAKIIYSEILATDGNEWIQKLQQVNSEISYFCQEKNYVYCSHEMHKSKKDWFKDNKHIDPQGGTRMFVADLLRAAGKMRPTPPSHLQRQKNSTRENYNPRQNFHTRQNYNPRLNFKPTENGSYPHPSILKYEHNVKPDDTNETSGVNLEQIINLYT